MSCHKKLLTTNPRNKFSDSNGGIYRELARLLVLSKARRSNKRCRGAKNIAGRIIGSKFNRFLANYGRFDAPPPTRRQGKSAAARGITGGVGQGDRLATAFFRHRRTTLLIGITKNDNNIQQNSCSDKSVGNQNGKFFNQVTDFELWSIYTSCHMMFYKIKQNALISVVYHSFRLKHNTYFLTRN